jgi:Resolvase, N terminal domain
MAAARAGEFQVVLVDDLSRLARDNHLMLSIIAELHFEGIRVVSVADGLDSTDEESTLAIQVRGIFNELQLRDQIGQKERGFFVGETFGYRSVPVGEMRMDKKGRPRPEGYTMENRAEGGGNHPPDPHLLRRWRVADANRQDAQRGERAGKHQIGEGLVRCHRQPDPREREVHRALDLEPDREPTGPEDRPPAALREA